MNQHSLNMILRLIVVLTCSARFTAVVAGPHLGRPALSEAPAGVIGEVVEVATAHHTHLFTVRTESGSTVSIIVDEATEVKRLPPGERSIENASEIAAGEVALGDRVYARGARPDSSGIARARQLIVISSIDERQESSPNGESAGEASPAR